MGACIDCGYLDKSRKKEIKNHEIYQDQYRYGCNAPGRTFIVGTINMKDTKETDLKYMGGNCWKKIFKEIEQMRLDI
jgi:hypothetical protein